ncbi:MAG TPA: prepilin-type N-terminal cleavage/methylation domain-containing protein [Verrucomicrobiae bacterium]|nr:prepilin-type N-terminal cleavage/methylation domain-containing protein [Verrucomicrobiae bacterium]
MKRKAFTLIELLITALLLVVVAGYSVVIFSSTVGMYQQTDQSNGAAVQIKQSLDIIGRAFAQSSKTAPVVILNANTAATTGNILVFTSIVPTTAGAASSAVEQRAYCVVEVGAGKYRLAEFILAGTYNNSTSSRFCTAIDLANAFPGTVTGPTYLTDATTNVTRFIALPIQYGSTTPSPDPSGIRLTMTSMYDPAISDSTFTERADTIKTLPLTVERTAYRNLPNNTVPFSGL